MRKIKVYFFNILRALRGDGSFVNYLPPGVYRVDGPIVIQGGGGPGEPQK